MINPDDLLYADELAEAMRRSRCYIYAMKAAGFEMPGRTATVNEARAWLRSHTNFSTTGYYKKQNTESTHGMERMKNE
jgi:hypothetical protein